MANHHAVKSGATRAEATGETAENSVNFRRDSSKPECLNGVSSFSFTAKVRLPGRFSTGLVPLVVWAPDAVAAEKLVRLTCREFYGAAFVDVSAE
jgi:hypothetical protein